MNGSLMRYAFWIGLVVAAAYAIQLLSGILLPFVAGAGIAFFLDPVVDRLELVRLGRWRLGRSLGAFLALGGFLLTIVLFFVLVVPILVDQAQQLIQKAPRLVEAGRQEILVLMRTLNRQLAPADAERLRAAIGAKFGDAMGAVVSVVTSVLSGGVALASLVSLFVITPIVAFFLLRDWDVIIENVDSWLPRPQLHILREQGRQIQETLSGFLRGQAAVCLVMGVVYAIGLTVVGLDFSLVLGLFVGFLIFIPFLGGLSGALLCVVLAYAQFGSWHQPLEIAILFGVGQMVEGNVLTPKLVGDRVHLHPVWIIFALLASGALFGFVGILLAVPIAAVIGVLVRFAIRTYLLSPLYDPLNIRLPEDERELG